MFNKIKNFKVQTVELKQNIKKKEKNRLSDESESITFRVPGERVSTNSKSFSISNENKNMSPTCKISE